MANTNIFIVAALCAVFGIGLIDAYVTGEVPQSFTKNDPIHLLQPVNVEVQGNSKVFKFGNEAKHGSTIHKVQIQNSYGTSRDVNLTGGYPGFFEGTVTKLSYVEITVESDGDESDAKFFHYVEDQGYYARSLYRYGITVTNATVFNYKIEIFE